MKQHPLSSAFPAMPDDQFESLKDSISNIGVQEPITVFEGMVLDGWHRFTAANEVGAQCPTVELGDVDPQDFVIAKNKARRHITASQLAAAVVAVYGWRAAGRNPAPGAGLDKTSQQLADMAGVSERTIRQAKVVEAKATPEVKEAVKAGVMSVKKAAETVNPPKAVEHEERDVADESASFIAELADENETLRARLAVGVMEGTDEEKREAAETITHLRQRVKSLEAEVTALRASRDGFQREASELRKQIKMNEKELKKARAAA